MDFREWIAWTPSESAVISQRGMGAALGLGDGGSKLPRLVATKSLAPYVGPELREKLEKPLIFQGLTTWPATPPAPIKFPATDWDDSRASKH